METWNCFIFLFSKVEIRDEPLVGFEIFSLEIIQKLSSLGHQLQEATARMIILDVRFKVPPEIIDALG